MSDRKPYRPSNGTEGDLFTERFCDRCAFGHDRPCPIRSQSWLFPLDHHEYPNQWVMDGDDPTTARCTCFADVTR